MEGQITKLTSQQIRNEQDIKEKELALKREIGKSEVIAVLHFRSYLKESQRQYRVATEQLNGLKAKLGEQEADFRDWKVLQQYSPAQFCSYCYVYPMEYINYFLLRRRH